MSLHPLAGKPAPIEYLANIPASSPLTTPFTLNRVTPPNRSHSVPQAPR
jgi:hypothetical protein